MSYFKAASKITQSRDQKKLYQLHRNRIKSMKSLMKINPPIQPDFVYSKFKLQLSRKQRRLQIDKNNSLLLKKMNDLKFSEYNINKLRPESQILTSLNKIIARQMQDSIQHQNKRICQKLLKSQTHYHMTDIMHNTAQLKKIKQNISFNARRIQSAKKSSSTSRPKSSYTTTASTNFLTKGEKMVNHYIIESQKYKQLNMHNQNRQNPENFNLPYSNSRPQSAPSWRKTKKSNVINLQKKISAQQNQQYE